MSFKRAKAARLPAAATASSAPPPTAPPPASPRAANANSAIDRKAASSLRRLARRATRIVLTAFATWHASTFLLQLGGHALWLPEEWRATVRVVGVAFATSMFEVFLARQQARAGTPAAVGGAHSPSAARAFASWSAVVALVAAAAWCRSEVIVRFEPSPAWLELHGHVPVPSTGGSPPIAHAKDGALPPLGAADATPASPHGAPTPDPIPSYIDFERKLVYVPFEWAWPDEKLADFRRLGEVGENVARMPWMQYLLAGGADELFHFLDSREGQRALFRSTLLILAIYCSLLLATASALARTYPPLSALVDRAVGH